MWIFNEDGFFSTVVDKDDPRFLAVRSRDASSLANFNEAIGGEPGDDGIVETRDRDYPYRVWVPKAVWVGYMADKAETLDYVDYKSHMTERFRHGLFNLKQLKTLADIWTIMSDHWEVRGQDDR